MKKIKRLTDAYRVPGFIPQQVVSGIFGDPKARVIRMNRIEKKHVVRIAGKNKQVSMIERSAEYGIFPVVTCGSSWNWRFAGSPAGAAGR
jgi:hypothetical protein